MIQNELPTAGLSGLLAREVNVRDAMMITVRRPKETCPRCGCTEFNPRCPECSELEEALRHFEQGIDGVDV